MNCKLNWNAKHPGHIVYLVDLSGSMERELNGKSLVDNVMNVLYSLFINLDEEVAATGEPSDLLSATVIGYNSDVEVLHKSENGDEFDKFVYNVERTGVLFDPEKIKPQWQTYMAAAFDAAAKDINEWLAKQKNQGKQTPAPVVINITDGKPEESGITIPQAIDKALKAAENLKSISTPDGNALLFNIHITPNKAEKIILPSVEPTNDEFAKFLYKASSVIPSSLIDKAKHIWPDCTVTSESKAMVSNENDVGSLLSFITWGSSTGGAVSSVSVRHVELPKP